MTKAPLSLAVRKAIGFTVASVLMAAIANATTLDNKIASGAYKIITGDFDGDQKADVLYQGRRENEHELKLSTDVSVQRWKDGFLGLDWNFSSVNLIVGDFNGDAAGDVILQSQSPGLMTQVMHAEYNGKLGNPVQAIGDYHQGFRWDDKHHRLIVGDFNGDMKDDIFLQGTHNKYRHGIALASQKGTFDTIAYDFDNAHLNLDWSTKANNIFAGDFDGNGQSELLLQPINMGYVSLVRSEKAFIDTQAQSYPNDHLGLSWLPKDHRVLIGDFNGDSKDDVFLFTTDNQQKSALIPSDGKGFSAITQEIAQIPNLDNLKDVLVADFDADSIDDIVLMYNDGSLAALMAEGKRLAAIEAALKKLSLLDKKSSLQSLPSETPASTSVGIGGTNTHSNSTAASTSGAQKSGATTQTFQSPAQSAATSPIKTANAVGRLAGEGGVSGGAASYTIPIAVPPGRNGMQPSVSLSYSSRAGNGVAGIGWSLNAGQSSVHRCPSTVAQDGFSRGVMLDAKDKLCLDGQRLLLESGTYGESGAVYRTEIESFVTVTQSSTLNVGTSFFTVNYPDGGVAEYKKPHIHTGVTAPMSWLITNKKDHAPASGYTENHINYEYTDFGNAELLLSKIVYSESSSGTRSVNFSYENRADINESYQSGGRVRQTKRLASISTKLNTTEIRKYVLDYKQSAATNRSLVRAVQECVGTVCLPETTFEWRDAAVRYSWEPITSYINDAELNARRRITEVLPNADYNGDGVLDWRKHYVDAEGKLKGTHPETIVNCVRAWGSFAPTCYQPDFDRDGITDSFKFINNKLHIDISEAPPVTQNVNWVDTGIVFATNYLFGKKDEILAIQDFNADGWPDLMVYHNNGLNPKLVLYRHTKSTTAPYNTTSKQDVYVIQKENYFTGYTPTGFAKFESRPANDAQVIGDQNGDGFLDLAITTTIDQNGKPIPPGTIRRILYSTVSGSGANPTFSFTKPACSACQTAPADPLAASAFPDTIKRRFEYEIDVNGDGLEDLIRAGTNNTGHLYLQLNTGSGYGPLHDLGAQSLIEFRLGTMHHNNGDGEPDPLQDYYEFAKFDFAIRVMDIDGDGKNELLMPKRRVVSACSIVHEWSPNGSGSRNLCDDALYGTYYINDSITGPIDSTQSDNGVYEYEAFVFNLGTDGKWTLTRKPSGIYGSPAETAVIDAFGNGLSDVVTTLGCRFSECTYSGTGNYAAGVYINRNLGSAAGSDVYHPSDMMVGIKDGFNAQTQWTFAPLSTGKHNSFCTGDFYQVDRSYTPGNDDSGKSGYLHFASSMYAVAELKQSNGLVNDFFTTNYCYEGAVYNVEGRGFQGFRKVVESTAKTNTGTRLKTQSTFDQKFPKAGMVNKTETWAGTALVSTTTNTNDYIRPVGGQTWLPYLKKSVSTKKDTNGSEMGTVTSEVSVPKTLCGVSDVTTTTVTDAVLTHVTKQTKDISQCTADWPGRWESERVVKTLTPVGGTADIKFTNTVVNTWDTILRQPKKITTGDETDTSLQLVTELGFDAYGNTISSSTYAAGTPLEKRTSSSVWSADGYFAEKAIDALGQTTQFTYDATHGQVLVATDAIGNKLETRYDEFGRAKWAQKQGRLTTGDAATTTFSWASSTDKTSLPAVVYKVTSTHPNVKPTSVQWFDALNRVVRVQSEDPIALNRWINQDTQYDNKGRVTKQSVPYFDGGAVPAWTEFKDFDVLDRPAQKVLPNDNSSTLTIRYTYNGLSASVQVGDDAAYSVTRSKNALGQWWQTTDQGSEGTNGEAITTKFRYDANGNPTLISRTPSSGVEVKNTAVYNTIGQKLSMTDPERGTWSFSYNIWGELTKQTDAKLQRTWLDYDIAGRPLKRFEALIDTKPATPVVTWVYDKTNIDNNAPSTVTASVLSSAVKDDGTGKIEKAFYYNAEGQPKQVTTSMTPAGEALKTFITTQGYNSNGLPNAGTLPNSRGTVSISYNSKGFATSSMTVNGSAITPYQIMDLDAFGNTVSGKFGNGLFSTQTFSKNTGRILTLCVNASSGCGVDTAGNVQAISYAGTSASANNLGYDAYGNLKGQHNFIQNVTEEFKYDRRMRLTQSKRKAVIGGGFSDFEQVADYQYDQLGNLTKKSDFADSISYDLTGKPHQAHKAVKNGVELAEYFYDANGNLTSSTGQAAQARTSVYNHQMVPTSITRGSASSLFAYDESNERYFEKHISNGKTEKIYKLGKAFELKFTTEAGVTTEEEQHYLGSQVQLMYKKAQNGKAECYQWRYLHTDRLGSVETITNQNKAVLERHGFDPFGKPRAANWMMDSTRDGTTNTEKGLFSRVTTRGYTGHDHIDSVGVIHMNGRAYDPELGRFMGVDPFMQAPLNSQSLNPYSYVMNNPLAGTDPTGYKVCELTKYCGVGGGKDENGNLTPEQRLCNLTCLSEDNGNQSKTGQANKVELDTRVNEILSFQPDKFGVWQNSPAPLVSAGLLDSMMSYEGDFLTAPSALSIRIFGSLTHSFGDVGGMLKSSWSGHDAQNILTNKHISPLEIQDAKVMLFANLATLGLASMEIFASKAITPTVISAGKSLTQTIVTREASVSVSLEVNVAKNAKPDFIVSSKGTFMPTNKDFNLVDANKKDGEWFQIHNTHTDAKAPGVSHTHYPESHNLSRTRKIRTTTGSDLDNADDLLRSGTMRERLNRNDTGGLLP